LIEKYAQNRKEANKKGIIKTALGLLPKYIIRGHLPIYTVDESGAKTLRNDLLARAFLKKED